MSLVRELAARVRAVAEDLPLPQVRLAAERLRSATALLGYVLAHSVADRPVPTLAGATEHLDAAAGALRTAQDRLAEYLTAVGLSGGAVSENRDWRAALTPEGSTVDSRPPEVAPLHDWWAARVHELTGESGEDRARPQDGPALLKEAVARAMGRDRAGLSRQLVSAGAAAGLGLAALTPAVLEQLAAELVGHPPGPDDRAAVRAATLPFAGEVLPGLDRPVLEALVDRVCRAPVPPMDTHPADGPVAGTVLVAALLTALGKDPDHLTREACHPVDRAPRRLLAARA